MMPSMCKKVVCFDLDDTLYKEVDYLKSGYRYIASRLNGAKPNATPDVIYNTLWTSYQNGESDPFGCVIQKYGFNVYTKEDLLNWYRYHKPDISLAEDIKKTLEALKKQGVEMGIISDGRKITQLNKIEVLGLEPYMSAIIINDNNKIIKPSEYSYRQIEKQFGKDCDYYYIGDNTGKDFIAPNALGWTTVCLLNDGNNIHPQDFSLPETYLPKKTINNIGELLSLI